jgi:hypothetical protein
MAIQPAAPGIYHVCHTGQPQKQKREAPWTAFGALPGWHRDEIDFLGGNFSVFGFPGLPESLPSLPGCPGCSFCSI